MPRRSAPYASQPTVVPMPAFESEAEMPVFESKARPVWTEMPVFESDLANSFGSPTF